MATDSDAPPPENDSWRSTFQKVGRDVMPYADLGLRLLSAAAGPPLLGVFFDAKLNTAPWGLVVGAVIGLTGAGYILVELYHAPPPSQQ